MHFERTIQQPVEIEGVGLHSGVPVRARILPASAGSGIVFERVDLDGFTIPAQWKYVARVSYATSLMRFGASGYLNKECPPEEIVEAIRVVARGRRYISPAVAELLADNALGGGDDKPPHEQLSEREMQVFLRLARGETIGAMAESMFLSVKTVSTYRSRVLQKLKLASNSELTYYALKNGLIQ